MMKRHMTFIACALSLLSACSFDHFPQSVKVSAGASPPIARASASAVVSGPPSTSAYEVSTQSWHRLRL